MFRRPWSLIAAGTLAAVVAWLASTAGQVAASSEAVPSIWLGTWRLDVARSDFGPGGPPYKRGTRRIEQAGDAGFTIVDEQVRNRGGILHLEWTGKLDGQDYPVQGAETALTVAYRCDDERDCDLVQKIDGHVVATARVTISPDGRTLTTSASSASGARAILVYDRQ
jgi:hypothetical protein